MDPKEMPKQPPFSIRVETVVRDERGNITAWAITDIDSALMFDLKRARGQIFYAATRNAHTLASEAPA